MLKNCKELFAHSQKAGILIVVILILTILQPGVFLTATNFKSILLSISIYGIMVCGTIFTILLGGIDLSVGAIAAASAAFAGKLIESSGYAAQMVPFAITAGLLFGALIGSIHGIIVAQFGVPAFLITLASQNIVYGVAQLITDNKVIICTEPESFCFIGGGRILGVTCSIYIMIIMAVICYILLNYTVFGRQIYAVGGNIQASILSGIKSRRIIILAYAFSGFTAAMGGIVLASMNRQAIAKAAQGYENDVLTAIVVGGVSLIGGEGNIAGAIWGAFLVGMVGNGLRLMGIATTYHGIIKGIVIIAAVASDTYVRYRGSGLQKPGRDKRKSTGRKTA